MAFARLTRKWPPVIATVLNAVVLVVGDASLAHRTGAVDPLKSWAPADVGIDVLHKASLAGAATALIRRRPPQRSRRTSTRSPNGCVVIPWCHLYLGVHWPAGQFDLGKDGTREETL